MESQQYLKIEAIILYLLVEVTILKMYNPNNFASQF